MKAHNIILVVIVVAVTVMTIPSNLIAQDATIRSNKAQHHHYKLIDMDT